MDICHPSPVWSADAYSIRNAPSVKKTERVVIIMILVVSCSVREPLTRGNDKVTTVYKDR